MSVGTIQTRYVEEALIPDNAFSGAYNGEFKTNDGVIVKLKFMMTMDNKNQRYFDLLDDYCHRHYGMGFTRYESEWYWRSSGDLSDFWHIIKMEKVS